MCAFCSAPQLLTPPFMTLGKIDFLYCISVKAASRQTEMRISYLRHFAAAKLFNVLLESGGKGNVKYDAQVITTIKHDIFTCQTCSLQSLAGDQVSQDTYYRMKLWHDSEN